MTTLKNAATGAARGTGLTAFVLGFAAVLGFGVPLFWVFAASKLAGSDPSINMALALFITTGILLTYWVVLLVALAMRSRWVSEEDQVRRVHRMSWNRSFRDEPFKAGEQKTDPVERLFMASAILGLLAFEIWFFFFAGSSLPQQTMF